MEKNKNELMIDNFGNKYYVLSNSTLDGKIVKLKEINNKSYFYNKLIHREDGPAIESIDESSYWYQNGVLHREDGPAIENIGGDKKWFVNGKLHREDGPAIENISGTKEWYKNGLKHREDGPAIENIFGGKYFINGEEISLSEFLETNKDIDVSTLEKEDLIIFIKRLKNKHNVKTELNTIEIEHILNKVDLLEKSDDRYLFENIFDLDISDSEKRKIIQNIIESKNITKNVFDKLFNEENIVLSENINKEIIFTELLRNEIITTEKKEILIDFLLKSENIGNITKLEIFDKILQNQSIQQKNKIETNDGILKNILEYLIKLENNDTNKKNNPYNIILESLNYDYKDKIYKLILDLVKKEEIDINSIVENININYRKLNNFTIAEEIIKIVNFKKLKKENIDILIKNAKYENIGVNLLQNNKIINLEQKQINEIILNQTKFNKQELYGIKVGELIISKNKSENLNLSEEQLNQIIKEINLDISKNRFMLLENCKGKIIDTVIEDMKKLKNLNFDEYQNNNLFLHLILDKSSRNISNKQILEIFNLIKNDPNINYYNSLYIPEILRLNIDFCIKIFNHCDENINIDYMHPILLKKLNLENVKYDHIEEVLCKYDEKSIISKIKSFFDKEKIQNQIYAEYELIKKRKIDPIKLENFLNLNEKEKDKIVYLLKKIEELNGISFDDIFSHHILEIKKLIEEDLFEQNDFSKKVYEKIESRIELYENDILEKNNLELLILSNLEKIDFNKEKLFSDNLIKKPKYKNDIQIKDTSGIMECNSLIIKKIESNMEKIKSKNFIGLYDYQVNIISNYIENLNSSIEIYKSIKNKEKKTGRLCLSSEEVFNKTISETNKELEKIVVFTNMMSIRENNNNKIKRIKI